MRHCHDPERPEGHAAAHPSAEHPRTETFMSNVGARFDLIEFLEGFEVHLPLPAPSPAGGSPTEEDGKAEERFGTANFVPRWWPGEDVRDAPSPDDSDTAERKGA
jgi:hypothetical protein